MLQSRERLGLELEALEVRLPGLEDPLQVEARVIWTSDGKDGSSAPGMGVQFLGLQDEARETINTIVRNLRTR